MAAGLPVVATRCGGPEEIVEDGVSGFLVSVQAPGELAEALRCLLADPQAARAMGQAAAARAGAFSLEEAARRTEEVYEESLASSARRPEVRALRDRLADFVAGEVLSRTRQAAGGLKPTPISISGPS